MVNGGKDERTRIEGNRDHCVAGRSWMGPLWSHRLHRQIPDGHADNVDRPCHWRADHLHAPLHALLFKFKYTTPLQTAVAFLAIVVLLDFFLEALIIERNMDMFRSLLGTWIPWALIFLSTYLTGLAFERKESRPRTV
jgi:hypothetical protein